MSFQVSTDRTASRIIDDEAVVINLETGHYYGMNGPATYLWNALAARAHDAETLGVLLVVAYDRPAGDAADEARAFLDEVVAEGLVEDAPESGAAGTADVDPTPPVGPYERPTVDKYDRLEQLMLSGE